MTMNENERERWRARTVMEMDVVFSHCYDICWSKKAGLDQTLLSLSLSLFIGLSVRPLLRCSWVSFKKNLS